MHATLISKSERNVIFSRRFFEAFVDLFGAFFLSLKDYFCVSRIVSSHAKIHKSDNDGIICLRSLYMVLSYQRTCIVVSPILVYLWGPKYSSLSYTVFSVHITTKKCYARQTAVLHPYIFWLAEHESKGKFDTSHLDFWLTSQKWSDKTCYKKLTKYLVNYLKLYINRF